jgi:hypothetical protein
MKTSISISPLNSLIFIHAPLDWISPTPVRDKLIWSTPSCIATACYPEQDGPTEITMGVFREVALHDGPAFEGMLETPGRKVEVTTVADDRPILSLDVPDLVTRVKIWHSDPRWPDKVAIGLG